jgi:hypothetical protein
MEEKGSKPVPLSQDELTTLGKFLPTGTTILGGIRGTGSSLTINAEPCVLVFYGNDDHTIHKCKMCGSGDSYEISDDTVVGSW